MRSHLRRMEEAAADLERRMEAVFVVDETASAEEEKNSDVADAGTTKDSENDNVNLGEFSMFFVVFTIAG